MSETKRDKMKAFIRAHARKAILEVASFNPNERDALHSRVGMISDQIAFYMTEKYAALEALDIISGKRRRHPFEPSRRAT